MAGAHAARRRALSAGAAPRGTTVTGVAPPPGFEQTITLPDGTTVRLRPIRPDDEHRLVALYDRLSLQTAYQRFFTVMRRLPPDWAHFLANVDYRRRFALVVEHGGATGAEVIAVARYEPTEVPDLAELAFVVQDGWQNKGLGTRLLQELLRAAAQNGLRRFRALVLAENSRMLDMLTRFTDVQERKLERGVVELTVVRREST